MSTFHFEAPDDGDPGRNAGEAAYTPVVMDPDAIMTADSDSDDDGDDDDDDDLLEPFPSRDVDFDPGPRRRNVEEDNDDTLRPGDHVFVWRAFGLPRAYQKHGIVLSIEPDDPSNVTIVSFYHKDGRDREASDAPDDDEEEEWNDESLLNEGESSRRQNQAITAGVRTESLGTFSGNVKVHKVKYGQGLARRLLKRAGTATSCEPDERPLVIARVRYLLENPSKMPDYHMLSANGECAAVWCRIGRWCTLQGSSILHIMFVGSSGTAVAGGVVASNVCFWAPMPGFWGSIGYWWYVPATVAYPILVPILIGFGMVSLVPLEVLRRYRKKWQQLTKEMNSDFWVKTDDGIKEYYFASSVSTDADWMKKFFMDNAEKEEEEKGQYMPLDSGGGLDGDDEEDELMRRMAAEYGGQNQKSDTSFREHWQGMIGKINKSFSNRSSKSTRNIRASVDGQDGLDDSRLLNGEGASSENGRRKWGVSWTNRSAKKTPDSTVEKQSNSEDVHVANLLG